jgi:hypothetical protein
MLAPPMFVIPTEILSLAIARFFKEEIFSIKVEKLIAARTRQSFWR